MNGEQPEDGDVILRNTCNDVDHSKHSIFAIWNPNQVIVCVIRDKKKFFSASAFLEK